MVNTRRSSRSESISISHYISSRTRSSVKNNPSSEEHHHKDPGSDVSSSGACLSPPAKRTRRLKSPVCSDSSPSPLASVQREEWRTHTRQSRSRLSSSTSGNLQNGHSSLSRIGRSRRNDESGSTDHSIMNGNIEVRRSCRSKRSRFESVNQSMLFDQLVNSTAEAVLQEMDSMSNIRQNREVERLRMWTDTEFENMDMYSRVKRRRKPLRRPSFGIQPRHEVLSEAEGEEEESQEEEEEEEDEDDEDDEDDEVDEAEEAEGENGRPYNLRQRKTVQRYQAPPIEPTNRKQRQSTLFDTHRSPARRSHIRVKKHAIHSSDTTSSSDEERFERRKSKSMTRARNRCLPMNLRGEDLASGILRDRVKVGASLADVDPMTIDTAVRFDSVGGLGHHIQALKEMVVFPLLYPEVFERFKIQPPRGCLFYGPPGTGKTLVARALANECSQGDRKVSFFMRKGADCLSKWVGESERQLRLLFDQAYLMRPSIIFFDEIDGLAPVRSSRQDQIHSSIVSTLLALMDGLDNRGEIVVIGATNRLDSIDPALRRPGRFDREFLFNLPDKKARKHILKIHTRDWNPKLADAFLDELAEKCVGYCGADIKALCTEAALIALRRRYPQIYASSQKLQLDVSSIILSQQDFYYAMKNIVPASQRAVMSPGQALSPIIRPLLENIFGGILANLQRVFPHAELSQVDKKEDIFEQLLEDDIFSDDEVIGAPSIFDFHSHSGSPKKTPSANSHRPFLHFTVSAYHQPTSYRPRLLLAGDRGSGQSTHLAPAVLHSLEKFSVHRLDLPTLYSVSAKTPEESCAQVFREARRTVPCVVYMPMISEWWDSVNDMVRTTIVTLLQDIPSFTPILILATSEIPYGQLHEEVKSIFRNQYGEVVNLKRPNEVDRRKFFGDLILIQSARPPSRKKKAAMRALEVLLPAVPPPPRELSEEEKKRLADQEENTLRELRLFLRDVTKRLATDKRFNIFSKPVDIEEVSDYLEVIKQPMDLSTIMTKIDTHKYFTVKDFLVDIDLICSNALEYNPDKDPGDKIIRHRACTLKDTAHAIFAAELDPEFNRMCEEIKESRMKRGFQAESEKTNTTPCTGKKPGSLSEESSQNIQRNGIESSLNKCSHHIRRKLRRRPQWGRGIIRRRKYYLKKEGTEGEDSEPAEFGELEGTTDCHDDTLEEETADLSLTHDESSCDALELGRVLHSQNGPIAHQNGHLLSTEEESSNEPPVSSGNIESIKEDTLSRKLSASNSSHPKREDCINGDSSLDSLYSDVSRKSIEERELNSKEQSVDLCSITTLDGSRRVHEGSFTQKVNSGKPEQGQMLRSTENTSLSTTSHQVVDSETKESDHEKEGASKMKKCRKSFSEQLKAINIDSISEEVVESTLPLIVNHERLSNLLQLVVKKTENFTVDQLERLYSLLSQCIYRHRRDYDKTHLTEEMERTVQTFETFL